MAEAVLEQQKQIGGGSAFNGNAIVKGRLGQFRATASLTPMQRDFVRHFVSNGGNMLQAAKAAGYTSRTSTYDLLNLPHVRNAVRIEREKSLDAGLPCLGVKIIREMLEDKDTSQAVRAKLAMWAVDRAHPPKQQQLTDKKPIHQMSVEELEQFVKKGREALDNIKPALAQPVEIESEIRDSVPPTESDLASSSAKSQQVLAYSVVHYS